MAGTERREDFGSRRRKLVHVAAQTAAAAAGTSSRSAPANTSQMQMNPATRNTALGQYPSASARAEAFCLLGDDPLNRNSSSRIGLGSPSGGAASCDGFTSRSHSALLTRERISGDCLITHQDFLEYAPTTITSHRTG